MLITAAQISARLLEQLEALIPGWTVEDTDSERPIFRHSSGLTFPVRLGVLTLLAPTVIGEIVAAVVVAHQAGITYNCGIYGEWLNEPEEGYKVELRPKGGKFGHVQ